MPIAYVVNAALYAPRESYDRKQAVLGFHVIETASWADNTPSRRRGVIKLQCDWQAPTQIPTDAP